MNQKRILIGIGIVATALRLWRLWAVPFWYDENFTVIATRLPIDRMMLAIQGDVHPPLWYLTVWPIIQAGAPEWTIRIPSVIFSLAGLWIFWRILNKLQVDQAPALLALGIMAISPWQVYYAQEARMYAELQLLVLLGFEAAHDRNWLRFSLTSALMMYCQNYGAFYALAIGAYALVRNWRDVIEICLSGSGAALAYIPWFVGGLLPQMHYLASVGYWIGQVSAASIGIILTRFLFSLTIAANFTLPGIFISVFVSTCAVLWFSKHRPPGWIPIAIMFAGPIAMAGMVSVLWTPILLHRPLIACSPFLFTMLAYAMVSLKDAQPRAHIFAAVFLIPALLLSSAGYVKNQDRIRGGDELDRVEETIRSGWRDGDAIYVVGDGPLVNIMAAIPDLPIYRFPQCQPTTSYLSPETRQALGVQEVPFDQVMARRFWMVVGIVPFTPQCERDFIASVTHTDATTLSSSLVFGGLYILETK